MKPKKRGVASTDAKTFKAMEKHSTKLYYIHVGPDGWGRSLALTQSAAEFEADVASTLMIQQSLCVSPPNHRDEHGHPIKTDITPKNRAEAVKWLAEHQGIYPPGTENELPPAA